MKTTKHTPGPWLISPDGEIVKQYDVNNADGTWGLQERCIAEVHAPCNLALIAAAPTMFDRLREISSALRDLAVRSGRHGFADELHELADSAYNATLVNQAEAP